MGEIVVLIPIAMCVTAIGALVCQIVYYTRAARKRDAEFKYRMQPVKSDTWLEARNKRARGEFHRKVARRVAISLSRDVFELECGHRWPAVGQQEESYECTECLDEWIKEQPK